MVNVARWKVILVLLAAALSILFALPNLLTESQRAALPPFMPKNNLNLGLDLQGGSYLLLEVDTAELQQTRVANLIEDARVTLADAGVGVTSVTPQADGAVITISDASGMEAANQALQNLVRAAGTQGVPDRSVQRLSLIHI